MFFPSIRCVGYLGIYIMALAYMPLARKSSAYRALCVYAFDVLVTYGAREITKSLLVDKISTSRQKKRLDSAEKSTK